VVSVGSGETREAACADLRDLIEPEGIDAFLFETGETFKRNFLLTQARRRARLLEGIEFEVVGQ
jgi:hypothetical protein